MSGHSKWAQIKHAKAITDKKKGLVFSKLSKKIAVAVKEGGSPDPNTNYKLKSIVEFAKSQGLPNDNISRAIKSAASAEAGAIQEVVYEGYGPEGVAFLVDAVSDNPNRTTSSIKHIFSKHEGNLGAKGSVAWQFTARGQILAIIPGQIATDLEMIAIDAGAEDVRESSEGLEIYTLPLDLHKVKNALVAAHAQIVHADIIQESSQNVDLNDDQKGKVQALYEELSNDDDVTAVHVNANL